MQRGNEFICEVSPLLLVINMIKTKASCKSYTQDGNWTNRFHIIVQFYCKTTFAVAKNASSYFIWGQLLSSPTWLSSPCFLVQQSIYLLFRVVHWTIVGVVGVPFTLQFMWTAAPRVLYVAWEALGKWPWKEWTGLVDAWSVSDSSVTHCTVIRHSVVRIAICTWINMSLPLKLVHFLCAHTIRVLDLADQEPVPGVGMLQRK